MITNVLKLDPTRTISLRRRFEIYFRRRLKKVSRAIRQLIVTEDAFGIVERKPLKLLQRQWQFRTSAQKTAAFRDWLQKQIDADILTVDYSGQPWSNGYIQDAYSKGMGRAYIDTHKAELMGPSEIFVATKEQFLRTSFFAPETMDKIQLLFTRTFEELKGVGATMGHQMNRILAEGLASGYGPEKIARNMDNAIKTIERTRARVIARTEIINAHAVGQLDAFDRLGIEEVEAEVEILTAGDERVCSICASLEGQTYTIEQARGLIPLHPGCRCCWAPVVK